MHRSCVFASAGLAAALFLAAIPPAAAQQFARPVITVGKYYAGASAGIISPDSIHDNFSGALAGSADVSFDTGAGFTGFAGYHMDSFVALEGQLGYGHWGYDRVRGKLNGAQVSGTIDGSIDTILGLGNIIVTPLAKILNPRFSPYVGGGVGLAWYDARLNSVTAGGVATPVNSKNSEADFAADALVGLDVALANNLSVGGRYQFVWFNSGSTTSGSGVTTREDDATAHLFTLTATYHF